MDTSRMSLYLVLLLMTLASTSSKDLNKVKVKPGEDVLLQCNGPKDAVITLLEWIRPDLHSDGYVFFYRDDHLYENYLHQSFKDRVKLKDPEMKDRDVSVILKNVTINDTGTYECFVSVSKRSRTIRATADFSKTIELLVEDSGESQMIIKPGEDVILQCHSHRDADITALKWIRPDLRTDDDVIFYRHNSSYEKYQHPSFHGRVELKDPEMKNGDVSVILKNININDAGTYECYVGYGDESELIKTVTLTVSDSGHTVGQIAHVAVILPFIGVAALALGILIKRKIQNSQVGKVGR